MILYYDYDCSYYDLSTMLNDSLMIIVVTSTSKRGSVAIRIWRPHVGIVYPRWSVLWFWSSFVLLPWAFVGGVRWSVGAFGFLGFSGFGVSALPPPPPPKKKR